METSKSWTRPPSVPIPTVWRRFEGKKPLANGQIVKFRIQDYTEDMYTMVIKHMSEIFIYDEPTCRNQRLASDPIAVQELQWFWDKYLGHGVALVAMVDNYDELEDKTIPKLAGLNITAIGTPDEKPIQYKSKVSKNVLGIVDKCSSMVDCFKKYDVNEYLYALGLSVDPIFRRQGVGLELLKARFDIGRAVGLKLTVTVFTGIASQTIAEKAGFETIVSLDYKDFKDENGHVVYSNMDATSCKLMVAKINP